MRIRNPFDWSGWLEIITLAVGCYVFGTRNFLRFYLIMIGIFYAAPRYVGGVLYMLNIGGD